MRQAVIVIGCSYGDEGKGLAAAWSARRMGGPCLNVLINGGAQRGHTVDLPDGRRHVFHHFGSAALHGAVSCADEAFIVNPLLYAAERDELRADFGVLPRLAVSDRCRVSTPFDMMLGQIIEENRGAARHGSCGCGIYETRLRFQQTDWALHWGALRRIPEADYRAYCRRLASRYIPERLESLGMTASTQWQALLDSDELVTASWRDLEAMRDGTECYSDWTGLARDYPTLIFEAGQGLALDEDNVADAPHLTPSHTTSLESARRIAALPGATRTAILYVTRAYLTRHGAGPFPTECPKEAINPAMTDRTNVPNPHQQCLRYGRFDGAAVLARVKADAETSRRVLPDLSVSALVTHLNETGGRLAGDMALADFAARFDRCFTSDCPWDVRALA